MMMCSAQTAEALWERAARIYKYGNRRVLVRV